MLRTIFPKLFGPCLEDSETDTQTNWGGEKPELITDASGGREGINYINL